MLTKNIPALSLRAAVEPKTVNADARTVEVVWTTGAKVLRSNWLDGQFWEELSLDPRHVRLGRLNNGAPFLMDHDGRSVAAVAGVVESARLEGSKGVATIRFVRAGVDPEADKLFEKVRDGIVQNISVGYRIHKFEKQEGGEAKVPTFRATDWEPFEISAVSMGADDGAGFRSADATTNPCEFISLEQRNNMDPKDVKAPETAPVVDVNAVREEAVKAERARVAGINAACRVLGAGADAASQKFIAEGKALDVVRAEVLEQLAQRSEALPPAETAHVRATVTDDNRDKFVRGVSAWLFEKSGRSEIAEAKRRNLPEFAKVETDGGEFRGMTLVDVARACLERAGVSTRSMYNRHEIVKRALQLRGGAASISDFPILFENVLHKSMRAAYAVQPHTWRRWCGTDTVSDFRDAHRFLNGSFGTLPVVAEGGEYENLSIPDGEKLSIQTQKRGAIISVTDEMLINDDMGAMADLATRFGSTAGRSIDSSVYALLALNSGLGPTMSDSQPFFHSNRANVSSASGAISVANLDKDRQTMRAQTDADGNDFLDLVPSILLVSPALYATAKVLNAAQFDHDGTEFQKPSAVVGMFSDIIDSQRLTGTRRYVFTGAKEAFKVVFLEGTGEGPTMETDSEFRTDGMSWKVKLYYKAVPFDPKHAVTSSGA